jgi:hypothetical protein
MFPHLPFPETQTTLALSIFLFTFAYEDGATLLAVTLGAAGRLDARLGFASAFLGIWIGDMGLYALGSSFGRRAATSRWSRRFVSNESLAKAEAWFQKRGPLTIVMSRFSLEAVSRFTWQRGCSNCRQSFSVRSPVSAPQFGWASSLGSGMLPPESHSLQEEKHLGSWCRRYSWVRPFSAARHMH